MSNEALNLFWTLILPHPWPAFHLLFRLNRREAWFSRLTLTLVLKGPLAAHLFCMGLESKKKLKGNKLHFPSILRRHGINVTAYMCVHVHVPMCV